MCNAKIQKKEAKAKHQAVKAGFLSSLQAFSFFLAAQLRLQGLTSHPERLIHYVSLRWHAGRKGRINIQMFKHRKSPLNS